MNESGAVVRENISIFCKLYGLQLRPGERCLCIWSVEICNRVDFIFFIFIFLYFIFLFYIFMQGVLKYATTWILYTGAIITSPKLDNGPSISFACAHFAKCTRALFIFFILYFYILYFFILYFFILYSYAGSVEICNMIMAPAYHLHVRTLQNVLEHFLRGYRQIMEAVAFFSPFSYLNIFSIAFHNVHFVI